MKNVTVDMENLKNVAASMSNWGANSGHNEIWMDVDTGEVWNEPCWPDEYVRSDNPDARKVCSSRSPMSVKRIAEKVQECLDMEAWWENEKAKEDAWLASWC